jgi:L-threonylcarbamoyladenylate synthase
MSRWPGPHTWLLAASNKTSRLVRGHHANVAVRLDAHPEALALCRSVDGAIISTSLNRTGREPVRTYRQALQQFGRTVLVLPGRSAVAALLRPFRISRPGALTGERLLDDEYRLSSR